MKKIFFGLVAIVLLFTTATVNAQKSKATCRTFSVGVNIAIFSIATDVTICCTGGWCGCGTHPNCTMSKTSQSSNSCNNTSTENEINVDVVMNDSQVVGYISSHYQNNVENFIQNNKLSIKSSKPLEVDGVYYSIQLGDYTIVEKDKHYFIYAHIKK